MPGQKDKPEINILLTGRYSGGKESKENTIKKMLKSFYF